MERVVGGRPDGFDVPSPLSVGETTHDLAGMSAPAHHALRVNVSRAVRG